MATNNYEGAEGFTAPGSAIVFPDAFEKIISDSFGDGDYVRAIVEAGRTPKEKADDEFMAMWCQFSQARSEVRRQTSAVVRARETLAKTTMRLARIGSVAIRGTSINMVV